MKYNNDELNELERIIDTYKIKLLDDDFNNLISTYNKFYSSFSKFFTMLSSEKIINIDPYSGEYDLSKLDLPEATAIPYNEEDYVISIRLSYYNSTLTFIKTADVLNFDNLNSLKIDKIIKLVKFLDWNRLFDPQPIELNTEALNKVLFYYQKDRGQKMILLSLRSFTSDIETYSEELVTQLSKFKKYYKEKYKLWIRNEILPKLKLPPELHGENIKRAHDIISKAIKNDRKPLYIELVGEILKEDFTTEGETVRSQIKLDLQGITPENKENTKKESTETPIKLLGHSILELSKICSQTDSIIEKIFKNSEMVREENFSLFEKIIDYIKHNLLSARRETVYSLQVNDSSDTVLKEKEIELGRFVTTLKANDKILSKYKNNESEDFKDLISKDEEFVNVTLHQLISKCRYIYKILFALDTYYRINLNSPKGIQIELKVILSIIDKSQNIYFEYQKMKSDDPGNTTYKPDIDLIT